MKNIEFLSDHDLELIVDISNRATDLLRTFDDLIVPVTTIANVIAGTHLNGCKLDLNRLLASKDSDFCHDIGGILTNYDIFTGTLKNGFLPRHADLS